MHFQVGLLDIEQIADLLLHRGTLREWRPDQPVQKREQETCACARLFVRVRARTRARVRVCAVELWCVCIRGGGYAKRVRSYLIDLNVGHADEELALDRLRTGVGGEGTRRGLQCFAGARWRTPRAHVLAPTARRARLGTCAPCAHS